MIWFFEREAEQVLEYEIRQRDDSAVYELALKDQDGTERVERFDDPTSLIERSLEVQQELRRSGWRQADTGRQRRLLHDRGFIV